MSNLSDFGVDVETVDEPEEDTVEESDATEGYPNGRCPAITTEGRRCQNPVSRMNAADGYCGTHGSANDPLSIDDGPERLVRALGQRTAQCRAERISGERCPNSCGALEYYCGTHKDWPHGDVDEREDGELDVDRILGALDALQDDSVELSGELESAFRVRTGLGDELFLRDHSIVAEHEKFGLEVSIVSWQTEKERNPDGESDI